MSNLENYKNSISVAMISNAMNHHQFPFCDSMFETEGVSFHFIATKPIAQERLKIGFKDLNNSREYIIRPYESDEEYKRAMKIAQESDFVIYGSAPFEYIKDRIRNKKWTFIYSERLFKEKRGGDFLNIKTILSCVMRYFFASHKNLRLLCSSAFSSNDYKYFRFKEEQTYKWGYFPPLSNFKYSEIQNKKEASSIVWVGRFIDWKHPELAVELARKLKDNNISFNMKMIGDGPLLKEIKSKAEEYHLTDNISFLGAVSTDKTRDEMEKSQIMISTSDHNEGWGAIINEGMASGCAVVGSHLMGSVPYLINDEENGLIFESGNTDDLYNKVKLLLKNKNMCEKVSENAFKSISNEWNGKKAAERLVTLMRNFVDGKTDFSFDSGICSYAEHMKNDWYNN